MIVMSDSEEKMEGVVEEVEEAAAGPDLQSLKAAAREVVKEAETAEAGEAGHINGTSNSDKEHENGDSSEDNGVHENGSVDHEEEEMDEPEEDKENGSLNENSDKEEEEEEEMEQDPLADLENDQSNDIHSESGEDSNHTAVNGKSANEKSSTDGDQVNGDVIDDDDTKDSDDSDDIIIEKDENSEKSEKSEVSSKTLVTPKKKIEEVTIDDTPLRRSSRKKTPTKYAEMEKDFEEVEEIEEIKDDDSDILEVEPEDPLNTPSTASISITKSTKTGSGKKPNVVTIDDLKTLQLLATSAKKTIDSQKKESRLDTQALLAGKMGSGVSITPAKPRLNIGSSGLTLGSGVTIKPNTPKQALNSSVTITSSASSSPAASAQQKQEEYDPNLTDDTFVVEAPSFIVPYVYEKPPKEEIKSFLSDIKKLKEKLEEKEKQEKEKEKKEKEEEKKKELEKKKEEQKKRREERQKRRDDGEEDVSDDSEDEEEEESKEDEVKEVEETKKDVEEKKPEEKKPEGPKSVTEQYFSSTLGKFFSELGMNLVQEYVQRDLLSQQRRRAQKDKSVAVMHAISSLQKNLEDSEDTNRDFHHDLKKCRFCSFRTESRIVMQNHMETPHMKNFVYRCNFCEFETKIPQEVLFHMDSIHGVKGKLERAPYYHQCPQCSFEDNGKGKLTRHRVGCDKRFRPELNQMPERDWEPPAKIKAPPVRPGYPNSNYLQGGVRMPGMLPGMKAGASVLQPRNAGQVSQRMGMMSAASRNAALANRGRPVGTYKGADLRIPQPNLNQQNKLRGLSPNMLSGQQMLAALGSQGLSVLGSGKGLSPKGGSPSISITPLPGRNNPAQRKASPGPSMKPGQPAGGKNNFVICEICDGYIKDLEQLRNHMQWIHKVKIHPKMIHNRPPLNCQKCQFRFFTDQGLERHLLGSHGLVTASMQDAANKGQDSGRCPVCGKVYQWKLLNHVAKDHNKTLKPAHLSYKCTVCTATFGQYKLFESHVYTAHSGVAKKTDKNKQVASSSGVQKTTSVLKSPAVKPPPKKQPEKAEVIDLDDEEEIDDVEKDDKPAEVIDLDSTPKKSNKRSNEDSEASDSKKARVEEETEEKDPLAVDTEEERADEQEEGGGEEEEQEQEAGKEESEEVQEE